MTHHTPLIPIPCDEHWSGMDGDERKRLCASCDTHVHNLSDMNHDEAQALLGSTPDICVMYATDDHGAALYRDSPDPQWRLSLQLKGAQRLIQAAALALPMVFAGCQSPPEASSMLQTEVVAPIVVKEGEAVKIGVSSEPTAQEAAAPADTSATAPVFTEKRVDLSTPPTAPRRRFIGKPKYIPTEENQNHLKGKVQAQERHEDTIEW